MFKLKYVVLIFKLLKYIILFFFFLLGLKAFSSCVLNFSSVHRAGWGEQWDQTQTYMPLMQLQSYSAFWLSVEAQKFN